MMLKWLWQATPLLMMTMMKMSDDDEMALARLMMTMMSMMENSTPDDGWVWQSDLGILAKAMHHNL